VVQPLGGEEDGSLGQLFQERGAGPVGALDPRVECRAAPLVPVTLIRAAKTFYDVRASDTIARGFVAGDKASVFYRVTGYSSGSDTRNSCTPESIRGSALPSVGLSSWAAAPS
jgi:hypothetical protein